MLIYFLDISDWSVQANLKASRKILKQKEKWTKAEAAAVALRRNAKVNDRRCRRRRHHRCAAAAVVAVIIKRDKYKYNLKKRKKSRAVAVAEADVVARAGSSASHKHNNNETTINSSINICPGKKRREQANFIRACMCVCLCIRELCNCERAMQERVSQERREHVCVCSMQGSFAFEATQGVGQTD